MSGFSLGPQAKEKLTEIYRYTLDRYGEDQADSYVGGMFALFEDVASGTPRARLIPPEFGVMGYFVRYERHFVYWRKRASGGVSILAILHTSQLQTERLRAAFGLTE